MPNLELNLRTTPSTTGLADGTAELRRVVDGTTIELLVPGTIQEDGFERWLAIPDRHGVVHLIDADQVWRSSLAPDPPQDVHVLKLRLGGVETTAEARDSAQSILRRCLLRNPVRLTVVIYGLEESMWPMKSLIGDVRDGTIPITRWMTSRFPDLWQAVPRRYTPIA